MSVTGNVSKRKNNIESEFLTYASTMAQEFVSEHNADEQSHPALNAKIAQLSDKLGSVYRYCGSVASYENLPTSGMDVGDVYNVEQDFTTEQNVYEQSVKVNYVAGEKKMTLVNAAQATLLIVGGSAVVTNAGPGEVALNLTRQEVDILSVDTLTGVITISDAFWQTMGDGILYIESVKLTSHAGDNYAWTGSRWDNLAGTIDLSGYATKQEVGQKVTKVAGKGLSTNDYTDQDKSRVARIDEKADKQTTSGGFAGGQNAQTSEGGAVGMMSSANFGGAAGSVAATSDGGAVGYGAISTNGGAVGSSTSVVDGGAIGSGAVTSDGFAGGKNAKTLDAEESAIDAVQLGTGTNSEAGSLQVYSYKLMDANGKIPEARLPEAALSGGIIDTGKTYTYPFVVSDLDGLDIGFINHLQENLGLITQDGESGLYKYEISIKTDEYGDYYAYDLIVMQMREYNTYFGTTGTDQGGTAYVYFRNLNGYCTYWDSTILSVTWEEIKPEWADQPRTLTTTGTGSAYELEVPGLESLFEGLKLTVKFHIATVAGATLNVNGLGAYPIVRLQNNNESASPVSGGTVRSVVAVNLMFSNLKWVLVDLPKPLWSDIDNKPKWVNQIGDLDELSTLVKTDLVSAINEVAAKTGGIEEITINQLDDTRVTGIYSIKAPDEHDIILISAYDNGRNGAQLRISTNRAPDYRTWTTGADNTVQWSHSKSGLWNGLVDETKTGDLDDLTTTTKTNLVAAINEVAQSASIDFDKIVIDGGNAGSSDN